jgi:hypothetical protein
MVMGQRFAAWRIAHDLRNQSLSFDVRDGMLEDDFHLFQTLRKPRRNPSAIAVNTSPKEDVRIAFLMDLPSRWNVSSTQEGSNVRLLKDDGNIGGQWSC